MLGPSDVSAILLNGEALGSNRRCRPAVQKIVAADAPVEPAAKSLAQAGRPLRATSMRPLGIAVGKKLLKHLKPHFAVIERVS